MLTLTVILKSPIGQDPWAWGIPPKLWIQLVDIVSGDVVDVGRRAFTRVNIVIHFHSRADRVVSQYVVSKLRDGARVETTEGRISVHTHTHTLLLHRYGRNTQLLHTPQRVVLLTQRWRTR